MLDIMQTAAAAPAVASSTAVSADAGSAGEAGGFQTIMEKAIGGENQAATEGETEGDVVALQHPGGENLPIDGRPLPNAIPISTAMLTQITSSPHSDARPVALETALEGLPVQADGRLAGYLRAASQLEREGPIAPGGMVSSLPALTAQSKSKDIPVVATSEASAQFARLQALQTDNTNMTTPLMDFAAPTSPHNTHFASSLTQVGLVGMSPQPAQTSVASAVVPTPVQQPQWGDDVSNRVVWMVKQDIQAADMRLNPPHLGPLEVRISMTQDQVNISFSTHHGAVREALDNAMPRLRELLADNGLQLANANVSHRSASDQQGGAQHYGGNGLVRAEDDGGGPGLDEGGMTPSSSAPLYLVDYYA